VNHIQSHPDVKNASEGAGGVATLRRCLGCGSSDVELLLSFPGVPVQTTMVLETASSADAFKRADMEIGYCIGCGLISNLVFDESLLEYGDGFEESQFASATFREFANSLAARLITAADASGKAVTELGCGKGEFLALLSEHGAGNAVGIDPASAPDRFDDATREKLTFVREFYKEDHREMVRKSALVLCRHTLEHLGRPSDFLTLLRSHLEGCPETFVYFDLPDTDHVIDDGAFWEMNYEH